MNEAFEKIFERLKNHINIMRDNAEKFEYDKGSVDAYSNSMKIVREVAEEYNNGWIPCGEGLPEEHDSIFAKFKGTDKWNDMMFEKISDTVNVTVIDKYSNTITTHAHTVDGNWHCDLLGLSNTYRIIAWQPLPEPFKEGNANVESN